MKKVLMYTRFERFWHWAQALLIFFLALTGFEVHGSFSLFGYQNSVVWHMYAGVILVILFVIAIFWHFTTRAWRAYIPTMDGLIEQMMYYGMGIFKHEPHPYHKTVEKKHNPLQRLSYLGFQLGMLPVMLVSGIIYIFVADGTIVMESAKWLSIIHTLMAFVIIAFVIMHVYMTSTGHTVTEYTKTMITGYEEIEE